MLFSAHLDLSHAESVLWSLKVRTVYSEWQWFFRVLGRETFTSPGPFSWRCLGVYPGLEDAPPLSHGLLPKFQFSYPIFWWGRLISWCEHSYPEQCGLKPQRRHSVKERRGMTMKNGGGSMENLTQWKLLPTCCWKGCLFYPQWVKKFSWSSHHEICNFEKGLSMGLGNARMSHFNNDVSTALERGNVGKDWI